MTRPRPERVPRAPDGSPWAREIAESCRTREDAAKVYAQFVDECFADPERGEWEPEKVNAYIAARWSRSGLVWIKRRAWDILPRPVRRKGKKVAR